MFKSLVPTALIVAAGIGSLSMPLDAQTDPVTYTDMAAIASQPYGPFPEARAVIGDTSSIAWAVLPPGMKQAPHHHNQEQFTLGVGGALTYSIGGVPHALGSHGVGMAASNVEHNMTNASDQPAVMLEYQAVLRPEWLPPHAKVPPAPQSPQPAAVAEGAEVTLDFDLASQGWKTDKDGTRSKSIAGRTIRATFFDLSRAGATVDLSRTDSTRERQVYVLGGQLSSAVGAAGRVVAQQMLITIRPGAKDVRLSSLGKPNTLVVLFESLGQ